MNDTITIYRQGNPIVDVIINRGSKRTFKLMGDDNIVLLFSSANINGNVPVFLIGDYCDIEGERFFVNNRYTPTYNASTGGYDYQLTMEAEYRTWKNFIVKSYKIVDGKLMYGETTFNLAANLFSHAETILRVARWDSGKGFDKDVIQTKIDIDAVYFGGDEKEVKLMSYSGTDVITALDNLCKEEMYDCEWWVTKNDGDYTLHFGRLGRGEMSSRTIENGIDGLITRNQSQNAYATRVYAYGGTKNVPYTYRKKLLFTNHRDDGTTWDDTRKLTHTMFQDYWRDESFDRHTTWAGKDFLNDRTTYYEVEETLVSIPSIPKGLYRFNGSLIDVTSILEFDEKVSYGIIDNTYARVVITGNARVVVTGTDGSVEEITRQLVLHDTDLITAKTEHIDYSSEQYYQNGYTQYEVYAKGSRSNVAFYDQEFFLQQYDEITDVKIVLQVKTLLHVLCRTDYQTPKLKISCEETEDIAIFTREDLFRANCKIRNYGVEEWSEAIFTRSFFVNEISKIEAKQGTSYEPKYNGKYEIDGLIYNQLETGFFTSDAGEDVINGLTEIRLMLPEDAPQDDKYVCKNGYLELKEYNGNTVETVMIKEDIYPSIVRMPIKEVYEPSFLESTIVFPDASDSKRKYPVFTIKAVMKDSAGVEYSFSDNYIIDKETLHIKFTKGDLMGMTFESRYLGDDEYQVVPNTDYGMLFPNETLSPKVGDEVLLLGWDTRNISSLGMIEDAENRLLASAKDYLDKCYKGDSSYNVTMFCGESDIFAQLVDKNGQNLVDSKNEDLYSKDIDEKPTLRIGQGVTLKDAAIVPNGISETLRVIGFEYPLDIPWDSPQYTIGEIEKPSRLKQLERKIK